MYLGILKKGPAASLPTPWFAADSGSSLLSLRSCSHFPVFLGKFREVTYSDW